MGKNRDSGAVGTFAYQGVQDLEKSNFMISKYLDNFHNFIIFIVFVDLYWYVHYVNVSSASVFLLQKDD